MRQAERVGGGSVIGTGDVGEVGGMKGVAAGSGGGNPDHGACKGHPVRQVSLMEVAAGNVHQEPVSKEAGTGRSVLALAEGDIGHS